MAYNKKTWTDRVVEYPKRRKLTDAGTPDVFDVDREEGTVFNEGDTFNADDMNNIEQGIEDLSNEILINSYSNIQITQAIVDTFPSETLQSKLLAQIKGLTLVNDFDNGNFSGGTANWIAIGGTLSISNGNLLLTGDGSSSTIYVYQSTDTPKSIDDVISFAGKVKTPATATAIRWQLFEGAGTAENANFTIDAGNFKEYQKDIILTQDYTDFGLGYRVVFPDAGTANGAITEIDGDYGLFNIDKTVLGVASKTEAEMLELVRSGYFEGMAHSTPDIITSVKNRFDKSNIEIGDISSTTGLDIPSTTRNRTIEYIEVKGDKDYVINNGLIQGIFYYDINKNPLDAGGATFYVVIDGETTFRTPSNCAFIRGRSLTILTQTELDSIQIELGTTSTAYAPYVPYNENTFKPNITLRSLPNLTQDELRNAVVDPNDATKLLALDGWEHVKKIEEYVLQSADIESIANDINLQTVTLQTFDDGKFPLNIPIDEFIIPGFSSASSPYDDTSNYYKYARTTSLSCTIKIGFPLGTYATLGDAQADLAGTVINYELATPVITQPVLDEIWSFENGTIYQENLPSEIDYTVAQNLGALVNNLNNVVEKLDDEVNTLGIDLDALSIDIYLKLMHMGLSNAMMFYNYRELIIDALTSEDNVNIKENLLYSTSDYYTNDKAIKDVTENTEGALQWANPISLATEQLGQIFTIDYDMIVTSVYWDLSAGSSNDDFTFDIYTLDGSNEPDQLIMSGVDPSADGENCNVTTPTVLPAGTYVCVFREGVGVNASDYYYSNDTPYAGGWVIYSSDTGATWTQYPTRCMRFKIKGYALDFNFESNPITLDSAPTNFLYTDYFKIDPTNGGILTISREISFDNGANYQVCPVDTETVVVDTGTEMIIRHTYTFDSDYEVNDDFDFYGWGITYD